jgi:hypothetical protein
MDGRMTAEDLIMGLFCVGVPATVVAFLIYEKAAQSRAMTEARVLYERILQYPDLHMGIADRLFFPQARTTAHSLITYLRAFGIHDVNRRTALKLMRLFEPVRIDSLARQVEQDEESLIRLNELRRQCRDDVNGSNGISPSRDKLLHETTTWLYSRGLKVRAADLPTLLEKLPASSSIGERPWAAAVDSITRDEETWKLVHSFQQSYRLDSAENCADLLAILESRGIAVEADSLAMVVEMVSDQYKARQRKKERKAFQTRMADLIRDSPGEGSPAGPSQRPAWRGLCF